MFLGVARKRHFAIELGFVRKRPKKAEFPCSPPSFLARPSCKKTHHLKE
jgi:hypothetical protein